MSNKKTSWDYQKGRYKQINIKFNMDSFIDMKVYEYLKKENASGLIKRLIWSQINPCYGCMGASMNDCERCYTNEK